MTRSAAAKDDGRRARGGRIVLLIGAIAAAPVILATVFYYLLPREARNNYGELLPTQPVASIEGTHADGGPFKMEDVRGRWAIVMAAGGECAPPCERMLYATRQARTMQNAEDRRVVRVWLVTNAARPRDALLAEHPGLVVVRASPEAVGALPRGAQAILLVDPLGNQVLAWPADPDIKALARDLARLLKASRIG
jgi:hypothetical protein